MSVKVYVIVKVNPNGEVKQVMGSFGEDKKYLVDEFMENFGKIPLSDGCRYELQEFQ